MDTTTNKKKVGFDFSKSETRFVENYITNIRGVSFRDESESEDRFNLSNLNVSDLDDVRSIVY